MKCAGASSRKKNLRRFFESLVFLRNSIFVPTPLWLILITLSVLHYGLKKIQETRRTQTYPRNRQKAGERTLLTQWQKKAKTKKKGDIHCRELCHFLSKTKQKEDINCWALSVIMLKSNCPKGTATGNTAGLWNTSMVKMRLIALGHSATSLITSW